MSESPKRAPSLERYRPGAMHNGGDRAQLRQPHEAKPMPVEEGKQDGDQRGNNRRNNRRGGGGRGRGQGQGHGHGRDPEDLRNKLDQMHLESNDLRHRLNQRSRPPTSNAEEDRENGSEHRQNSGRNNRNQHRRVQGRGVGGQMSFNRPKRNTENFNPTHKPMDMRLVVAAPGLKYYNREVTSRDVILVNDLYCQEDDLSIYDKLLKELQDSGVDPDQLWQLWHGDSHVIADDKRKWKDACPTFRWVLDRLADYFNMDIKATRLNWYRDSNEWKPFHHDAAAVKPDKVSISLALY